MKLSTHVGRGLNGFFGWFLITSLYWGPILYFLAGTEGAMLFLLCAIVPFALLLLLTVIFLLRRRYADIVGMFSAFGLNIFAWLVIIIVQKASPGILAVLLPGLGGMPFYFYSLLLKPIS